MPSKSPEQKKFMQAVANNPKFAKKVKVPTKVGKEFVKADKAERTKMKKYRDGGIYTADMGQPPQDIDGGSAPPKKSASKKSMTQMDKKNAAYKELQAAKEKETKGRQLPIGGKAAKMGDRSLSPRSASAKAAAAAYDKVQNTRESEREVAEERLRRASKSEKNSYAKGGSIDGIAKRGRTNCKTC